MTRLWYALAIWVAIGLSSLASPRVASAQQADSELLQQQDTGDSQQKDETKGHSHKIIRPGTVEKHIFVWRARAVEATIYALAGALVLALPVAAVYELTSRPRATLDRGVTQSVLLLPPIVAGIVMVVQNSLALAFSLAGVATTVRFRSSLKDTNDAAYIFLAIAIGIAAGAQAMDVAVIVSGGSCVAALVVFGISNVIHKKPVQVAPPPVSTAGKADAKAPVVEASPEDAARNAAVVVSAPHDEHARAAVESLLDGLTKEWRLDTVENNALQEDVRLRYLVRTKKRLDADALVSAINAAGASQGIRAEIDQGAAKAPTPAPANDGEQAPASATSR
jgi:uncharacterized membrane protein YhiD involved in acid resistance